MLLHLLQLLLHLLLDLLLHLLLHLLHGLTSGSAVEVKSCSSIAEPSLLRPSLWPASLRPVSLMSAGQDAASLHMSQDALSSPVTVGGAVGDALPRLLPGVFFRCSARCP